MPRSRRCTTNGDHLQRPPRDGDDRGRHLAGLDINLTSRHAGTPENLARGKTVRPKPGPVRSTAGSRIARCAFVLVVRRGRPTRSKVTVVIVVVGVFAAHTLVRVWFFGDILPDTFYAKVRPDPTLAGGWPYAGQFLAARAGGPAATSGGRSSGSSPSSPTASTGSASSKASARRSTASRSACSASGRAGRSPPPPPSASRATGGREPGDRWARAASRRTGRRPYLQRRTPEVPVGLDVA